MVEWIRYALRAFFGLAFGTFGAVGLGVGMLSKPLDATTSVVGGLVLLTAWLSWPRRPNAWRADPPTQRQLAYAKDLGILVPPGASKGQVSDMISAAKAG